MDSLMRGQDILSEGRPVSISIGLILAFHLYPVNGEYVISILPVENVS